MQVAYSDRLSDTGQRSWSCSGQSPMACTVEGDFCQCSLQNPKQLLKDSWDPQEKDARTQLHMSHVEIWFLKVQVSHQLHKGECHIGADRGWKKLLRFTGTWS